MLKLEDNKMRKLTRLELSAGFLAASLPAYSCSADIQIYDLEDRKEYELFEYDLAKHAKWAVLKIKFCRVYYSRYAAFYFCLSAYFNFSTSVVESDSRIREYSSAAFE